MDEPKNQPTPSGISDGDAELAELIAAKANLQKTREARAKEETKEKLRLELKFEKELGPRGVRFELLDFTDLGEGFVVVKLAEGATATHFMNTQCTEADLDAFVAPHVVHPSKEAYRKSVQTRPGIAHTCANALLTLYGLKKAEDAKKA